MAKRPPPSIKNPTLEYFAYRGPHRVAIGDLAPRACRADLRPTSGRRCPIVAVGHGWLQPAERYADTMRYLASWGIIVVAPNTHRSFFSSHQGLALDMSRALRMVAYGDLGGRSGPRGSTPTRRPRAFHRRRCGDPGGAAKDDQIKAVVTVTAAETRPSAIEAAGKVEVPSLHLIGSKDDMAESDGARSPASCTGPAQLRMVKGSRASRSVRGQAFVNNIIGADSDKRVQQATRMLASAFFIRYLTDADQLADELENKIKGTTVEDLEDPDLHHLPTAGDLAAAAAL